MALSTLALRAGVVLAEDPKVTSNDDFFPWMQTLRDMAGGIMSTVIVISVIAFIVAALILMVGKLSSSSDLSRKSTTILITVVMLAALVGGASGVIAWATGLQLF